MNSEDFNNIPLRIHAEINRGNLGKAIKLLKALRPPDQSEIISDLKEDDRLTLLLKLEPSLSADILEKLSDEEVVKFVSGISTEELLPIIQKMQPDEVADLLGDIEPEQAHEILSKMEDTEQLKPLLLHPDESAGGLMTSEFLALRKHMTTAEAIEAIHRWKPDSETVYYLFVIDSNNKLCGMVNLRQLIIAEPETKIEDIMSTDVIHVKVGVDQEECAQLMSKYDLLALPVVDTDNTLLGVITVDDLVDVLVEEATEDIQRFGGAEPLKESYLNTSVFTVSQKRIGWLLLLFVTESLTGTVLRHFADELQAVVALSFFVPLLIGTGGNAGSQTTSTIIRAIALREIDFKDGLKSLWHEMRTGFLLGLGMGIFGYIRALLWGSEPSLAITVAVTLFCIVLWANILGAILPLIADRLKIDPTVISGPVMSTLVDATGLLIYLSIARVIIGL